jgi:hypothetical protein
MKKATLFACIFFAAFQSASVFAAHAVHRWRTVDLLQDGRFRFAGSDQKWYYYSLSTPAGFVPSDEPDIYFLPQGGTWTVSAQPAQSDVVKEEEMTIIQFDNKGAPADGQVPPPDSPADDSN